MKNLLRLTVLAIYLVSLNAHASFNIESIELVDSTLVSGQEVSAISLNEKGHIFSVEIIDGDTLEASQIKKINISRPKTNSRHFQTFKVGGEGSGG